MPKNFFKDYIECSQCRLDHDYDYDLALHEHKQLHLIAARNNIMEQNKVVQENLDLPQDTQAYVYAGLSFLLVIGMVVAIFFAL